MHSSSILFVLVLCTINLSYGFVSNRFSAVALGKLKLSAVEESDDEIRERLLKKMRKNLYSDKGVAYAPWVTSQIDEEAILEDMIRREKESKTTKKKTSVLDRGEIESSEGMKWRMLNNQVDLAWVTGTEESNQGYIVEKRPSYGGDFQEVASFREVSQLQSKGVAGGRYRYTDPSTSSGSWIYRVQDCDSTGAQNILCQCFVEVQTDAESKGQLGIAVGFGAAFVALLAAGYAFDPPL